MSGLTIWPVHHIPDVKPQMNLGELLKQALHQSGLQTEPQDVLAVTQKIVSKAEGRIVHLTDVTPSNDAIVLARQCNKDSRLMEVILGETKRIVRVRGDVVICETHHGFICANAGVDRSNVEGGDTVTLLPRDPDRSARQLARQIECGVIITDTFGRTWREGLLDVAVGIARVPLFVDLRGTLDTKGYPLQATTLAAVDALAAAAGLVMGKTSNTPVALIRGFHWQASDERIEALLRPAERDLFL